MAEYIFIDENYIKDYTQLTDAVDPELIYPAALLAQDKYINSRTGDNLMRKLKEDAAADNLTGLYETLVNDYLRKALVWWTMVELIPDLYVRMDNGAPQIRISDETNQIEQADLRRAVSKAEDNAQFYTKRMTEWLCVNGSGMPEYNTNTAPDRAPTSRDVYNESGLTVSSGSRTSSPSIAPALDECDGCGSGSGGGVTPTLKNGFLDYNDTTGAISLTADQWVDVRNNGEGQFTNKQFKPDGVNELIDVQTGYLDFSELTLGSELAIRNDFSVTPNTNNALLQVRYLLGQGANEYPLVFWSERLDNGSGIEYQRVPVFRIYMGDENTKGGVGKLQVKLSTNGTIQNAGSYVSIQLR